MIDRYKRDVMDRVWTPENKFKTWLDIEIKVCEAMTKLGIIPSKSLKNIKQNANFDINRINEIEKTVRHDVIAFLNSVAEFVGEDSRYIHLGLTSSDILDTAFALQLREASEIIIDDLNRLLSVLKDRAEEFKYTPMIGRTHGIHAEPITFGMKIAIWYSEIKRNLERMERARDTISYGKISGPVGTFVHLSPEIEEYICSELGLKMDPVSSQIIQRDRHGEFFSTLAIIASSLDKFAVEIRLLQRTEIREAEEYFAPGQKGSSAMPHKRNPILSENISGLARIVRANAFASLENIPLWGERDISHSSVERVIAPDSTILVDYMLNRFTGIIKNLIIYPEKMRENLNLTRGLIFSGAILVELAKKGLTREAA
jgi:adenylosuccinate lyase